MRKVIFDELVRSSVFRDIFLDDYGNYVVQRGVKLAGSAYYDKLLRLVAENADELKKQEFGPKLLLKLRSSYPELAKYLPKNKKNFANT